MRFKRLSEAKQRLRSSDESGFTMVELVIAIPVSVLILFGVLSTIGVAVGLQAQTAPKIESARAVSMFVDKASDARTCPELNYLVTTRKNDTSDGYKFTFGSYTCSAVIGKTANVSLPITVKKNGSTDTRTYYSKTLNLVVM